MPIILEGAQALHPFGAYTVQFGATATTATQAFNAQLIRLNTTAAVCVDLDGLAASTATSLRMAADQTEYFKVTVGRTLNCKAADSAAAGVIGTLYITECG